MSNDKNTSTTNVAQKVEVKTTGTTFNQNGVITNIFNGNKVETSVDGKTPQTITVKPNQEQQQPKVKWQDVLPDAQALEVNKILYNPATLNLPKVIGGPMEQIERNEKLKQGKQPAEINESNGQATPSKKTTATTVGLDSFSKKEQQALAYKTGDVDPDSTKLRQEVSRELQNDGVAKNDPNGKPRLVPALVPETEQEVRLFEGALRRRQIRLILAGKMKPSDANELKALFTND